MIDLAAVVRAAHELDPLPASVIRLTGLVDDPDVGVDQLAEVVAFDQALTLKMLRAANAAASASGLEVTTVHDAIARMGAAQVVAFAVAAHARGMLAQALPGFGLGENQLWRHSVMSALAVEAMPQSVSGLVPPEAFTAALLHDIGKLVLNRFLTPGIVALMKRAQSEGGLSPCQAEREIIEVHHAEVGGLVAQHWALPARIVNAIQYHHDVAVGDDLLCDLVHVASQAANWIDSSGRDQSPEDSLIDVAVRERISWVAGDLAGLVERVRLRFADVGNRYQQT